MTDYRLRNHDLLYAQRAPQPLSARNLTIFASIAVTVLFGVVSYLADRFNAAATGFAPPSPDVFAQHAPAPRPAVRVATPAGSRSGSGS